MDDLISFLRAQLDEDERVAREAQQDALVWQAAPTGRYAPAGWVRAVSEDDSWAVSNDVSTLDQAEHIARHDPARVLREVESKRRIVDSFAAGMEAAPLQRGTESYAIVRMVLRLLVLPYADRPGYQPEWQSLARPRT